MIQLNPPCVWVSQTLSRVKASESLRSNSVHGRVFIPELSDRERLDSAPLNKAVGRNPAGGSKRAIQWFDIFLSHLFISTVRSGDSTITRRYTAYPYKVSDPVFVGQNLQDDVYTVTWHSRSFHITRGILRVDVCRSSTRRFDGKSSDVDRFWGSNVSFWKLCSDFCASYFQKNPCIFVFSSYSTHAAFFQHSARPMPNCSWLTDLFSHTKSLRVMGRIALMVSSWITQREPITAAKTTS